MTKTRTTTTTTAAAPDAAELDTDPTAVAEPVHRARSAGRIAADTLGHITSLDDDRVAAARHAWPLLTDMLLPELAGLGIATPPGVQRVLDLAAETREFADRESDFPAWLADQDTADLTPAAMYEAYRDRRAAGDRDVLAAVDWELLNRALDALAAAADDITVELRGHFDGPAATLAEGVAAGLHEGLRAETAIGDDRLVHHWRAFTAAVPNAARIHAVYHRLLLVAGFVLAPGERALTSGVEWMRASADGPVELTLPTRRQTPPSEPGHLGRISARSGTAADLHRAKEIGFERERAEVTAAHEKTIEGLAQWLVGSPADLVVLDEPAPDPAVAAADGTPIPVVKV